MSFAVTFVIMLTFWVFFSGLLDWWHLSWGVLSSALVAFISHDFLFTDIRSKGKLREAANFLRYVPWLLYQILIANIHIAYLVLHPRMATIIDPHIIRFRTRLKKDLAIVTFANSITLTPGTITILIQDDIFYVHGIDQRVIVGLPGQMEQRVDAIYTEDST